MYETLARAAVSQQRFLPLHHSISSSNHKDNSRQCHYHASVQGFLIRVFISVFWLGVPLVKFEFLCSQLSFSANTFYLCLHLHTAHTLYHTVCSLASRNIWCAAFLPTARSLVATNTQQSPLPNCTCPYICTRSVSPLIGLRKPLPRERVVLGIHRIT